MKIPIIIGVVAVALAVAVWGVVVKVRQVRAAAAPTPTVRVEAAEVGDLVEVVSAPGKIQPKTKVSISARVSARIAELPFDEGAVVTRGNPGATPPVPPSVLVRLDANDLQAQLRATEARYAAQQAQITVAGSRVSAQEAQAAATKIQFAEAHRDLRRQNELLASRDVSQSVVDTAQAKADQLQAQLDSALRQLDADRANLDVLRHELDAADADIARARDSLSYTTITSPIDGVVTKVNAKVGELAVTGTMNNAGTVIMEVADLSTMLMVARVDEATVSQVEPGQQTAVHCQAYPDQTFEGTVQSVALSMTEEIQQGNAAPYYETEILLRNNGKRLYAGLNADADIATQTHRGVVKVPSQAVLGRRVDDLPDDVRNSPEIDKTNSFATVVYRVANGKTVVTPVKVGPSDVTHTMIQSGLRAGEPVVTGPYKVLETLKHDTTVKEQTPGPAAATQPAPTQGR